VQGEEGGGEDIDRSHRRKAANQPQADFNSSSLRLTGVLTALRYQRNSILFVVRIRSAIVQDMRGAMPNLHHN
jgi:hypothetical protein